MIDVRAITVCVNYSDYLRRALPTWTGMYDILVVTSPDDKDTHDLCKEYNNVAFYCTTAFYDRGASFNKGAAMSEAIEETGYLDHGAWRCFLDADICLPENWKYLFESVIPRAGHLYSARRRLEDGRLLDTNNEMCGYFLLFDSGDRNVKQVPVLDTGWRHAGGYDTEFQSRWNDGAKHWLPFDVLHMGNVFENWYGVGEVEKMKRMWKTRSKNGRVSEDERI